MIAVKATQAHLKELLGAHTFLPIRGQLLYRENGHILMTQIRSDKNYTVEDYMKLPEGAPYQLINGKLIHMPSPFVIHQEISANLLFELMLFVRTNKLGKVYAAPLDVHFDEDNVFQPDLLFISNESSYLIDKWVNGAPDLVVEILSKGTASKDRAEKFTVYAKYGVKEYWIIDADLKTLELYVHEHEQLVLKHIFKHNETLNSYLLEGLKVELSNIFS